MTIDALLSSLSQLGIVPVLGTTGPRLTGCTSKITPELREELQRNRDAVVVALSKPVRRIVNLDTGETLEEWGAPNLSHVKRLADWKTKLPEARISLQMMDSNGNWHEFTVACDENRCSSCGAPIVWAMTPKGKRMPVNAAEDPAGNLWLTVRHGGGFLAFAATDTTDEPGDCSRHTSHFATCPNAPRHRKAKQ
jgi:hypothetical protein